MSVRVMKCELVHNRSAVSAGMRGRRSSLRTSSTDDDDTCFCSLRDCMACVKMAPDPILCCAAVGRVKRWSVGCSLELFGACV